MPPDEFAQQLDAGIDHVEGKVLVGLVGLVDTARAKHYGIHAELLQKRRFGAEGDVGAGVAGEFFRGSQQGALLFGEKRRRAREQRNEFGLDLKRAGDGGDPLADFLAQAFDFHAGHQADVELQLAMAANAVWIVAAVDCAEVERRMGNLEKPALVAAAQLVPEAHQLGDDGVHGIERVAAERWIRGMAAAAEQAHRFHHDSLVAADRPQAGGLADDRRARPGAAEFGEGAGALHRGFLVGGGEDDQRLLEFLIEQRPHGFDSDGEEALHVGYAEAVELVVALAQAQRIGVPQRLVAWHGVGVAGEDDAAGPAAPGRDQVELVVAGVGRRGHEFAGEAERLQLLGQEMHHRRIAHVDAGIGRADAGERDHLAQRRQQAGEVAGRFHCLGCV